MTATTTGYVYTIDGRTPAEQMIRHGEACMEYAREELAAGNLGKAEAHLHAAENWFTSARAA